MERPGQPRTPSDFIAQHSVFRLDEFEAAYRQMGRPSKSATKVLAYHVMEGRLLNLRRGLYARASSVDPWLLASKLATDVVVSHDGALSFHGLTGLGHRISFMTTARTSVVCFNEVVYQPLRTPEPRVFGNVEFKREGQSIFVTSLEATFVDCLARFERGPPPEELLELFRGHLRSLDPSRMIQHATSLGSRLVISRLAYFLICSRCDLGPSDAGFLEARGVQESTYFLRSARTRDDRYIKRLKLIVPPELERYWPGNG